MGKILDQLADLHGPRGRVLSVTKLPDGNFELREECDGYFNATLTPDELRALGQELIELADA